MAGSHEHYHKLHQNDFYWHYFVYHKNCLALKGEIE